MAFDGVEVEVRFKVAPAEANRLAEAVGDADLVSTTIQHDQYFDRASESFLSVKPLAEWLSLRQRGETVILNHKLWHYGPDGVGQYCDETELAVPDAESTTRMLEALGFHPLVAVNKTRRAYRFADEEIEVVLDEIEGLGSFVECEATKLKSDIETTRRNLLSFAHGQLGLSSTDEDTKGYPWLLLEEQGLL